MGFPIGDSSLLHSFPASGAAVAIVKFIEKLARHSQAFNKIEGCCSLVDFMAKPQITVRLSPSLLMELDQYVENIGTSKTDVVVSAIAQYIGWNESVRLSQRVAELERRVTELEVKR